MKNYCCFYNSIVGKITIICNDNSLIGLFLENQKHYPKAISAIEKETPIIRKTKQWLDIYFSGKSPDFDIPLELDGGTAFQKDVWQILLTIPYGKTITYGKIAKILAEKKGITRMSAQAVGGAVGRNKISIVIPCHRVIGANGKVTGYDGGIDKKITLLKLEKAI